MTIDAILLVGGEGTRLRPLTLTTPKPMLPVAGVPLVAHQLARARDAGIDHVVLATSYKAELFEAAFGDGSAMGLELEYVTEVEPLGTGGGIRNVLDRLRAAPEDPVAVFNGDVLSAHDLSEQIRVHVAGGAAVTLHLSEVSDPRAYGCVPTDPTGRVTDFLEKTPDPVTNRINAGCYVFRRAVIDSIPAGRPVSVERETFPALLAEGALLLGFLDAGYWLDLGTPEAFVQGSRDMVRGVIGSSALTGEPGDSLVLDGASVAPDAAVVGGSCVGVGARVGPGAVVDGSVLFAGAFVDAGATVRDSAVGRDAVVGTDALVEGAVLGDGAHLGSGNELLRGARLWPSAVIADRSLRFSPGP
ncbi:MAG TPA: NDP-sugar synthase [Mycobacteriales bacterium]|nr:NDP-sugar synthase [Mycobacteriales bacterium]